MEVGRKAYLASIVPVIVNTILNEHQIVVDIVAFVNKGDFPRSRLGEKQRGKILATWVTRKMRTMAQFGIRDPDSGLSDVTETLEPRSGVGSIRGSVMSSSLRHVESAPQIVEQREWEHQQTQAQNSFAPLPTGISEMPATNYHDDDILPEKDNETSSMGDDTPTEARQNLFEKSGNEYPSEKNSSVEGRGDFEVPGFEVPRGASGASPPRVGPKPGDSLTSLPAVEGREGDLWSLPSQQRGGLGGLRVQNASSDDDDDWTKEAIMHMNLAGDR